MGMKEKGVWEDELSSYSDEDYDLAQARLEKIAEPLRAGAESDRVLYRSLEAIVLGTQPAEVKESMIVCLLERFFLRPRGPMRN